MKTNIPEKLLKIAKDIESDGPQNVTRLTVLKKWFEMQKSLSSFVIFIAKRASSRKGKSKGDERILFRKSSDLLKDVDICNPIIPLESAKQLFDDLTGYQNEVRKYKWNDIRIIKNNNLYMIEESIGIFLSSKNDVSRGYRLAVSYCENYNSKYGNALDNKSICKINEIVRFMFTFEALNDG